jgi:hypothetical protein
VSRSSSQSSRILAKNPKSRTKRKKTKTPTGDSDEPLSTDESDEEELDDMNTPGNDNYP